MAASCDCERPSHATLLVACGAHDTWRCALTHALDVRVSRYAPFAPERAEATLAELRAWVAAHRDDADKEYVARVLPTLRARLRATSLDDGPAVCDVPPLADRLVLFRVSGQHSFQVMGEARQVLNVYIM